MPFFRSKAKYRDRVWLSNGLKDEDVLRQVQMSREAGLVPLTVFHFKETGKHYQELFLSRGQKAIMIKRLSELDLATPSGWLRQLDVLQMSSDLLTPLDLKALRKVAGGQHFSVHLLERYPLPEPDELVLKMMDTRTDMGMPTAYVSLEEPWLAKMLGDRVKTLLDQMGADPNEVMEHSLISSSLRRVQQQMSEKVPRESPESSIDRWIKANLGSDWVNEN